jgi:Flp pilus assembly protein TadG
MTESSPYRRRGSQRGTSMAEFSLISIPCLTLFFAIMNFALALYCYDFVGYSAQQAARYAIVHGATATQVATTASMKTYVTSMVAGVMDTTLLTVTTTWAPDSKPGSVVTVTVGYTFKPLTGLVSKVNLNLSQTAVMVISQ